MKLLICFLVFTVAPSLVFGFGNLQEQVQYFQSLYDNPADPTQISTGPMNKGETRPKAVLKGVYYFGGTNVSRQALSSDYKKVLCESGFSQAYSVYTQVGSTVSCEGNSMKYNFIGQAKQSSDGGDQVARLMQKIYEVIKSNGEQGPIYVHCFYGVHASNTISQMVLKQFCGISDAKAFDNWDKVNIYNSLPAPGPDREKAKIAAFQPDPGLQITAAEKALVCY